MTNYGWISEEGGTSAQTGLPEEVGGQTRFMSAKGEGRISKQEKHRMEGESVGLKSSVHGYTTQPTFEGAFRETGGAFGVPGRHKGTKGSEGHEESGC